MREPNPFEVHLMNKLSGDAIQTIKLTKIWVTAIASVIIAAIVSIFSYNIADRFEIGHAVVTTKTTTVQTVNYPNKPHIDFDADCKFYSVDSVQKLYYYQCVVPEK